MSRGKQREFIEQWKIKNWNKKEYSDNIDFWDHHKEEYLELLPNHAGMFDFDDEVEQDTLAVVGN